MKKTQAEILDDEIRRFVKRLEDKGIEVGNCQVENSSIFGKTLLHLHIGKELPKEYETFLASKHKRELLEQEIKNLENEKTNTEVKNGKTQDKSN